MKVKTSITLSQELLNAIDAQVKHKKKNRSKFLETAAWALLHKIAREDTNLRDMEIIERRAEHLDREAADVLEYQVPL